MPVVLTKVNSLVKSASKLPSLQAIGMPQQFTNWRHNQEEATYDCVASTKRATVISAPTGFGKEVLCVATARLSDVPTAIVTASKGLQDQYLSTYQTIGMVDLRGRDNYTCALKADVNYTCADGYNARCPYKGSVMCPASQAEMKAATSKLVLTNYDKWTHSRRYGMGLEHIQHVIFDEGHHMPDALAKAMQVTLHHKEIEETLAIPFLDGTAADDMHEWKQWAIGARGVAEEEMIAARNKLINTHDPKIAWVRHYSHMRNLVKRLGTLSTAPAKNWVVEQVENGYQFDPIRPGSYAESALFLRVPKITVVSATVRPKTMYMCNLGSANFTFHEFDSDFDPRRCPIYWVPTMRVEYGRDLSPLWARLDQIISRRRDRKGIIHTISYARRDEILNTSRYADSMYINAKGEPPTQMVEAFKASAAGNLLVSPIINTGYNFEDDACRFQFVCKVPFAPPSKIQKARQEDDKEYAYYGAMQYLVQAFGRDVRNNKDWSERFIGDDHFGEWFYPKYGHLAPKSFHAVYKQANILPPPLKL